MRSRSRGRVEPPRPGCRSPPHTSSNCRAAVLVRRPGEVISRDEFLDQIWGVEVHVTHRTVDTHLSALRRKIEDNPDTPTYIVGVRGVGYRFEATSTEP